MNISQIAEARAALEQNAERLGDDAYSEALFDLDTRMENAVPRDLHEVRLMLEYAAERVAEHYPAVSPLLLRGASRVHGHMLGRPCPE